MALTEGSNQTNVGTLKTNIQTTFNTLAAKTDVLDGIYTAVTDCWKGPDADKYLQEIYTKATELIESCKTAYAGIDAEIDATAASWETFQNSN